MTKLGVWTIGVWGAALTGAGALAYTLRPPVPSTPIVVAEPSPIAPPLALAPEPAVIVELVPTVIEARPARLATAPQPAVAEVRCAPWRNLQQGAELQQVRTCE